MQANQTDNLEEASVPGADITPYKSEVFENVEEQENEQCAESERGRDDQGRDEKDLQDGSQRDDGIDEEDGHQIE